MWIVETLELRPRTLNFQSAGLASHPTTALVADGIEIANALDLLELDDERSPEPSLQIIVCEQCGTPGCASGNRVTLRELDGGLLLAPDFAAMARGDWELDEYRPPSYIHQKGAPLFQREVLAALPRHLPLVARPTGGWPPLTVREAALLLQWEAPSEVLGLFPHPPRLEEERIATVSHGEVRASHEALNRLLAQSLTDLRPASSLPGEPVTFDLDQPDFPGWAPLTWDGTEVRLALAPGLGLVGVPLPPDLDQRPAGETR